MTGLLTILRHELAGRRLLFAGALLLGLLPLAAPLLPDTPAAAVPELRATLALFLAFALSGLAALLLGATVIGADLAEHRLSFYFTRPLAWWSIWGGKLGAAALCAWGAGLLVLLPALAASAGGGLLRSPVLDRPALAAWALALPPLLLAAHTAGVVLRQRSAWLILDLLALAAIAGIAVATVRRLLYWGVLTNLWPLAPGAAVTATAVLLAASAVQVAGGRTDPRRAHRLLSVTLAGLGLAAALGFAAGAERRIDVHPDQLNIGWTLANAPRQTWVALTGLAPGGPANVASFLLQPETGRVLRLRNVAARPWAMLVAFSGDGRRAVWLEPESSAALSAMALVSLDLDRPGAAPRRTLIGTARPPSFLQLSPRGDRVLVATAGSAFSIFDLASGRQLAAHSFGDEGLYSARFAGEGLVRLLLVSNEDVNHPRLDFRELDLSAAGPPRQLGTLSGLSWPSSISPDLRHAAFSRQAGGAEVFEVATGRRVADLRRPGARISAFYLSDGRLAEIIHAPAATELVMLAADGTPSPGTLPCRLAPSFTLVPMQAAGDEIVAMVRDRSHTSPGSVCRMVLLDVRRGTARPLGSCMRPVGTDELLLRGSALSAPIGGTPLFLDDREQLVRVDLATGTRRVVALARSAGRAG
jgi:hypothetical protein